MKMLLFKTMKISKLIIISLIYKSVEAKLNSLMLNLNENLFDSADVIVDILEEDIMNFKSSYSLLDDAEIRYQEITSSNTLSYNGKEIALNEIRTPVQIFTDGASYHHNGIPGNPPPINIYQQDDDESTLTVVKNIKEETQSVLIFNKDSNETVELGIISPLYPLTFATVTNADYDYEKINNKFFYESGHSNQTEQQENTERLLYNHMDEQRQTDTATCKFYLVLELAIAYESSFCRKYGGKEGADQKAASVVVHTSNMFQNYLCVKIKISHLEGYCDSKIDPYKQFVDKKISGCDRKGLVHDVRTYWMNNRKEIHRDAMNLLSGTELEIIDAGAVVGCAFRGKICDVDYSFGVDYIPFTSSQKLQAGLVAHELGHICGATHYAEKNGYIMNARINEGKNGFSSVSLNSINTKFSSVQCVEEERPSTNAPSFSPLEGNELRQQLIIQFSFFVEKVGNSQTTENEERISSVLESALINTLGNPNLSVESKDFSISKDLNSNNRYFIEFKTYEIAICINICSPFIVSTTDQVEEILNKDFDQRMKEASDVYEVHHLFKNAKMEKTSFVSTDTLIQDITEAPSSSPTKQMTAPLLPPSGCRNPAKLLINKMTSIFI